MEKFEKIPIIKTGQMVYFKTDPDKKPYKWKVWDHMELVIDNEIGFINKKEAKYKYILTFNWKLTFKF
jgi:hypothetical protein